MLPVDWRGPVHGSGKIFNGFCYVAALPLPHTIALCWASLPMHIHTCVRLYGHTYKHIHKQTRVQLPIHIQTHMHASVTLSRVLLLGIRGSSALYVQGYMGILRDVCIGPRKICGQWNIHISSFQWKCKSEWLFRGVDRVAT